MARRNQRPGDYLMTDDTLGVTVYASEIQKDYWGNLTTVPLQRNLQEIASPLKDPYPVSQYRGPQYEFTDACTFELQPRFIGKTTIPFPNTNLTSLLNLDPGIGQMAVGCTFTVR